MGIKISITLPQCTPTPALTSQKHKMNPKNNCNLTSDCTHFFPFSLLAIHFKTLKFLAKSSFSKTAALQLNSLQWLV